MFKLGGWQRAVESTRKRGREALVATRSSFVLVSFLFELIFFAVLSLLCSRKGKLDRQETLKKNVLRLSACVARTSRVSHTGAADSLRYY